MGLIDNIKKKFLDEEDSVAPARAEPGPGQANLEGPKPGNPGYRESEMLTEEEAQKKYGYGNIFNRDIQKKPGEDPKPDTGSSPQAQAQVSGQADIVEPPDPARVALPAWTTRYDMPEAPKGGGFGGDPRKTAIAEAGGSAMSEAQKRLYGEEKDINTASASTADRRGLAMEAALADSQLARMNMRDQAISDEQELRNELRSRRSDEMQLRRELRERADIDPNKYWKDHPAGEVGGRMMAGLGGFFSALGGKEYARQFSEDLDRKIQRNVDAQSKSYENRMGLSREVRQQWQDRMASLGDIHKAKLSAQMQDLEAASDMFKAQAELQKNDAVKQNLLLAANHIDQKMAEKQQLFDQEVEKGTIKNKKQQAAASAALAEKRYQEKRSDAIRAEEMQAKASFLDANLEGRQDVAAMRGAGKGSQTEDRQVSNIAKKLGDKDLVTLSSSVDHVDEMLKKGVEPKAVPSWLTARGQHAMASAFSSDEQKELIRGINMEANILTHEQFGATLTEGEKAARDAALGGAYLSKKDMMLIHNAAVRFRQARVSGALMQGGSAAQERAIKNAETAKANTARVIPGGGKR